MARQLKEYIVVVKHENHLDSIIDELSGWGITIDDIYKHIFPGFRARLGILISNWIKQDSRIESIEEVQDFISFAVQEIPLLPKLGAWHLDRIDQRNLPLSGNYTHLFNGTGITAYIIDSGAQFDHTEFNGRISSVDQIGNAGIIFDPFIDARLISNPENSNALNSIRGFDEIGHGTHVAGIIGSTTYGVAKNITIKTAKVFGLSSLTSSSIILSAIDAVIDDHILSGLPPAVANMSLGGLAPSSSTVISNTSFPSFLSGETIFIDGIEVTLIGSTVDDAINSINNAAILNISASRNFSTLKIIKSPGLMTFVEGNGSALSTLGFNVGVPASIMTSLERAIETMINNGITVIVAAGNQGVDANTITPARMPQLVTVGATDRQDSIANFSNFGDSEDTILPDTTNPKLLDFSKSQSSNNGSAVDLYAPGMGILSTWINTVSSGGNILNRINVLSGTSMASPVVAGIAAIALDNAPILNPEQVKQKLLNDATPGLIISLPTGSNNLLAYSIFNDNIVVWLTPRGSLGQFNEGFYVSILLETTTTTNDTIAYSLESGTLPVGLLINSITGELSGIPDFVLSDTMFNFTIRASAGSLISDRTFTIEILDANRPLKWITPNNIGSFEEGQLINFQFSAISQNNISSGNITYSTVNPLPHGWTLTSSGVFIGTSPIILNNDLVVTFTIISDDTIVQTQKDFNIIVTHRVDHNPPTQPIWQTPSGIIGTAVSSNPFSANILATDIDGTPIPLTYHLQLTTGDGSTFGPFGGLPIGLTLDEITGEISGTMAPISQDQLFDFGVWVTDGANVVGRLFGISGLANPINKIPEWITPFGSIGSTFSNQTTNYQLEGIDIDDTIPSSLTYTIVSGNIPPGTSFSTITIGNSNFGQLNGTISDLNQKTNFVFTVRLSDGIDFVDRTFSLLVNKVNQAPVWVTPLDLGSSNEGDFITINLEAADTHNDILTYDLVLGSLPSGLSLSITGTLSGVLPTVIANTQYIFTIRVNDSLSNDLGNELFTDQEFTLTITDGALNPNIPPEWITLSEEVPNAIEGDPYSSLLVANDPDNSPVALQYVILSGVLPLGLSLNSVTGEISGIPVIDTNNFSKVYNFVAGAFDGLDVSTRSFIIQVLNQSSNSPPTWVTGGLLIIVDEGTFISTTLLATDPDGVTYQITGGTFPPGLFLNALTGTISGQALPVVIDSTFTFIVRAIDTFGNFSDQEHFITILNVLNQPPVWNTPSGLLGSFNELTNINIPLSAIDPDNGPISLIYTLVSGSLPNGLSLNQLTGEIYGTALGVLSNTTSFFTITVSDGADNTVNTFSIEILDVPEFIGTTTDLYAPISGNIKTALVKWNNNLLIPDNSLYLPGNSLFGRVSDPKVLVAKKLHTNSINDIQLAFKKHHVFFKDLLGVPTFSVVRNSSGGIIYEVIYIPIQDRQDGSNFSIVSDLSRPKSVSYNFDNLRIEMLKDVNPNLSAAIPPETNNVGLGFENSEILPEWMTSEQIIGDTNSIIGYIPAIEVAFVKPGESVTILSRINRIQTTFIQTRTSESSFDEHELSGTKFNATIDSGDSILINGSIPVTFTGGDIFTTINDINEAFILNGITNIGVGVATSTEYIPNPILGAIPSLIQTTGNIITFVMTASFISFTTVSGTALVDLGLKEGNNVPTTFDSQTTTFDNSSTNSNPVVLQLGAGLQYSGVEVTFDRYIAKSSINQESQLKWFPDSMIPYWNADLATVGHNVTPYFVTPGGLLANISVGAPSTLTIDARSSLLGETITYSIVFGDLPTGLTLNSSTGEIEGLPAITTEISLFIVRATDSNNNFYERQFQIKVVLTSTVFDQNNTTFDINPLPPTTFDAAP